VQERPTFDFVPDICKEAISESGEKTPPAFTGKIVLFLPNFDERFELIEQVESGLLDGEPGETERKHNKIAFARRLVRAAKPFFKSVDITRVSDGKRFESFDDLSYCQSFDKALIAAGERLMQPEIDPN
jgi:hypothetical protein